VPGTARKMSSGYRRHPKSVVAYSAEVAHRAVLICMSFLSSCVPLSPHLFASVLEARTVRATIERATAEHISERDSKMSQRKDDRIGDSRCATSAE